MKVAPSGRWKYAHRIIMETILGRLLAKGEHVHHVNGDGTDNRPENLALLSHSEHSRITAKMKGFGSKVVTKPHRCPNCGLMHSPDHRPP